MKMDAEFAIAGGTGMIMSHTNHPLVSIILGKTSGLEVSNVQDIVASTGGKVNRGPEGHGL